MKGCARVIIDPSIHSGRMSFDQAVQLFVDSVGLERQDAVAEVTRYTTWPTQAICYIVGMQAIMDLRAILGTLDIVKGGRHRASIVLNACPAPRGGIGEASSTSFLLWSAMRSEVFS